MLHNLCWYSQHTQAEDTRHRVTVSDEVTPVPPVQAQASLPLQSANGSMVHRQGFHPTDPDTSPVFCCVLLDAHCPGTQVRLPSSVSFDTILSGTGSLLIPTRVRHYISALCALWSVHAPAHEPYLRKWLYNVTGNNIKDSNGIISQQKKAQDRKTKKQHHSSFIVSSCVTLLTMYVSTTLHFALYYWNISCNMSR